MEVQYDQQKPADGLAERRTSNELVKLIRKLRWLDLQQEAEEVQNELTLRREAAADSVVASPHATD